MSASASFYVECRNALVVAEAFLWGARGARASAARGCALSSALYSLWARILAMISIFPDQIAPALRIYSEHSPRTQHKVSLLSGFAITRSNFMMAFDTRTG